MLALAVRYFMHPLLLCINFVEKKKKYLEPRAQADIVFWCGGRRGKCMQLPSLAMVKTESPMAMCNENSASGQIVRVKI